ncbi:early endosome antigen 1 isoform X3 [Rhinoraja longicauda]
MFRRLLQRTSLASTGSDADTSVTAAPAVEVNNEGGSEGFICPICMQSFLTPTQLFEHDQNEHTVADRAKQEQLNPEAAISGFICPLCMKSHASAEELFKHYEVFHDPGNDSGPGEEQRSLRRDDIAYHQQELQDLKASLKEERWFSKELKKELDKVQGQLKQASQSDEVTSPIPPEISQLQSRLEDSQAENMKITQMKDLLEQKAATFAAELVDIKAKFDDEKSHSVHAEMTLKSLKEELEKEKGMADELRSELLQRPGIEDVMVLKKELVQVQTLMDKMSLEQEERSDNLKDENERLKVEFGATEVSMVELKAEHAKVLQENARRCEEIQTVQKECDTMRQQNQKLSENLSKRGVGFQELQDSLSDEVLSKKGLETSLQEKELDLKQLQMKLSSAEILMHRAHAELSQSSESGHKLKGELSEMENKYQQLRAEFKQTQQQREEKEQHSAQLQGEINQLHAKLLETERQLGEIQGRLKEQRQLSGEKLKDKEQQVADLQLKLSRTEEQVKESGAALTEVQHQLDKQKQQHQEMQTSQQNTTSQLRETQNDLEQVLRQIGDKDQKIQNLEALLQKSKDSIVHLETEREDLFVKIQDGKGDVGVLNQLQEKNHALQDQVAQLTEKLKNQTESHNQAQENLHKQMQEQKSHLHLAEDRAHSLETTIAQLTTQLSDTKEKMIQLDLQVKGKTELLLSAQASKTTQRADLENHLETAKHALQDKEQELTKAKAQLDEVASKLNEKSDHCSQLDSNLREFKEKQLQSEQRIEELESQIKKLESDVAKAEQSEERAQDDQKQLHKQQSAQDSQIKELSLQLQAQQTVLCGVKKELEEKSEALDKVRQQALESDSEKERLAVDVKHRSQTQSRMQGELEALALHKEAVSKELADTKKGLSKALEESRVELERDRHLMRTTAGEKERLHEQVKQELQRKLENATNEVNELKTLVQQKKQLKASVDGLAAQVSRLQGQLSERQRAEQQLQAKLKESLEFRERQKEQYEAQLKDLTKELSHKADALPKLQQEVAALSEQLAASKGTLTELQKEYQGAQASLAKLQSDMYGKESELSSTRHDLKAKEEKLMLAEEELVSSRNQAGSSHQMVQELKQAKASLETTLANSDTERKEAKSRLLQVEKEKALKEEALAKEKVQMEELQGVRASLEQQVNRLTEEARTKKQGYEKELTGLREAKQLLIQQKLELQAKADSTRSMLEQEKASHQLTKIKVDKAQHDLKMHHADSDTKLQLEVKEREGQRKMHEEAELKLSMQITALNENVATLKKEWQSSQRRVSELEKQTDDLRGEIAVLEATVQHNQEERRALLERCLGSEGEMEKLLGKVMDLRRKLDDTTAAMQELGRENQALQIKHTQALNRKWTEDTEVLNCMSCGKGFSVTIRKHHCRNCGNIFCAECSGQNALTPSSKKPVRVCNKCFGELQG